MDFLARSNFRGFREGKSDLVGIVIFDHLESAIQDDPLLIAQQVRPGTFDSFDEFRDFHIITV